MLLQLLVFGLLAAMANVLGGLIVTSASRSGRFRGMLRYLLALGAGFMLAVTFLEILPKTFALWQGTTPGDESGIVTAMLLFTGGYLLTQILEHTIAPHFHLGEEVSSDGLIASRSAYTAIAGLLIHTFFDGVAIAAAAQIDFQVGLLVFIGVFLHKFPEGFTIGSMLTAAGKGTREVVFATLLVGIMTFAGVMIFFAIGSRVGFTIAYALPIAGGVTLYVAASDLIPEVNHHGGKNPLVSAFVFVGVALFFVSQYLLAIAIGH